MRAVSVLAAGAVLGVRHALEADHLAAVATLVDGETDRTGLVGASWGVGHALPIVVFGLALVALDVRLPPVVTATVGVIVGLVLVALGGWLLWTLARGGLASRHRHDHGSGPHAHLTIGDLSLGLTHHHLDGDSFLVGLLHGLAGSGALVVLLVAAAPSTGAAVGFLAAFTALSIASMAAVAALWGRALGTAFTRYLEAVAGGLGIAVGTSLVAEHVVALGVL